MTATMFFENGTMKHLTVTHSAPLNIDNWQNGYKSYNNIVKTKERRNNMNVPDKIYIDDLAVVNDCVTKISLKQLPNFSEYIRKDALLEWAKEKNQRIDTDDGDYSLGYVSAMIDLIDKLKSM